MLFGDVQISNGIAWSKEKMFHIDACKFAIESFDWSVASGKIRKSDFIKEENVDRAESNKLLGFYFIGNGKKLYQIFNGSGVPTYTGLGLTIDVKDNLYIGLYNDSGVLKLNSE